jgi:hypothetical protein
MLPKEFPPFTTVHVHLAASAAIRDGALRQRVDPKALVAGANWIQTPGPSDEVKLLPAEVKGPEVDQGGLEKASPFSLRNQWFESISLAAIMNAVVDALSPLGITHLDMPAAAAVKTWLLAQITKKGSAPVVDIRGSAPNEPLAPERLAA